MSNRNNSPVCFLPPPLNLPSLLILLSVCLPASPPPNSHKKCRCSWNFNQWFIWPSRNIYTLLLLFNLNETNWSGCVKGIIICYCRYGRCKDYYWCNVLSVTERSLLAAEYIKPVPQASTNSNVGSGWMSEECYQILINYKLIKSMTAPCVLCHYGASK